MRRTLSPGRATPPARQGSFNSRRADEKSPDTKPGLRRTHEVPVSATDATIPRTEIRLRQSRCSATEAGPSRRRMPLVTDMRLSPGLRVHPGVNQAYIQYAARLVT